MAYLILSCDGGGIRGLFTARVLERLVEHTPKLVERVDLCAGTSTGGIISLALAAGYGPGELVKLYLEEGKGIFDDSFFDDVLDLGNAVGAQYGSKGRKKALTKRFGKMKLGELQKKVLITAFELDARDEIDDQEIRHHKPKFFHNFAVTAPDVDDRQELAVDVAMRTSAAPTYFPSYQGYIDGGVVANNPSVAALAQALDSKTGKQKLEDVHVLSIGTGINPTYVKTPRNGEVDWGWTQWAKPLISAMMDGVMGVAHYECKRILGDRYRRVDAVFEQKAAMDDVSDENLEYLMQQANGLDLAKAYAWLDEYVA